MKLSEKLYNHNNKITIALDGPSAAGKGLIGTMLAKEFALTYVQSSIVYRGLAYVCMQKNILPEDTSNVIKLSSSVDVIASVKGIDLNIESLGDIASKISVLPEVRANLGNYLQEFIKTTPRIVMEGRDIGTVVAPNADLKIFINANVEIRAERRYKQLLLEGKDCTLSDVLDLLKSRDERDRLRSAAPLKVADDAFVIDASYLTPAEIIQDIKIFVGK
ncbi:MAG: (d)CMP kinase [Rickettsiaceae bacterium]|nr:(d)CMP kinase [Rickettsiaceae bacterium]MDP4832799.1 (d)CMP kinase [Rickettsiaceae bacterium]MDP5020791.1 (d)CMP kinase [Rickettsiaceae bacterium]MDP5083369.1 (d)CMP kinase [Rickettsiaceae bacterium]